MHSIYYGRRRGKEIQWEIRSYWKCDFRMTPHVCGLVGPVGWSVGALVLSRIIIGFICKFHVGWIYRFTFSFFIFSILLFLYYSAFFVIFNTVYIMYRVFIKYCVFFRRFWNIFRTLASLCFPSVSVCVHTPGRSNTSTAAEKSQYFKEKHNN